METFKWIAGTIKNNFPFKKSEVNEQGKEIQDNETKLSSNYPSETNPFRNVQSNYSESYSNNKDETPKENIFINSNHSNIFNLNDLENQIFSFSMDFNRFGNDLFSIFNDLGRIENSNSMPSIEQSPRDQMLKSDEKLMTNTSPPTCESGGVCKPENSFDVNPQMQQPVIQKSFTSRSISRITRPDGKIEERETYRDSTGKEEVKVTEYEGGTLKPLVEDPSVGSFGIGFNILEDFFKW